MGSQSLLLNFYAGFTLGSICFSQKSVGSIHFFQKYVGSMEPTEPTLTTALESVGLIEISEYLAEIGLSHWKLPKYINE